MLVKTVSGILSLLAFAVTAVGGMCADNTLEFTLVRGLWALMGFAVLGAVLGWAAECVVREHRAAQYRLVFGHDEDRGPDPAEAAVDGATAAPQT